MGPDLAFYWFPWPSIGAAIRVGLRGSATEATQYGRLDTTGVLAAFGPRARAAVGSRMSIDAGPSLVAMDVAFRGTPEPGFTATDGAALAVYACAEGRGDVHIAGPVHASASLVIGAPLRTARAIAAGESIHEVGGVLFGGQIATGLAW